MGQMRERKRTSLHYWNHPQWSESLNALHIQKNPPRYQSALINCAISQTKIKINLPEDTPNLVKHSVWAKKGPIGACRVTWRKLLQFGISAFLQGDIGTAWSPPFSSCDFWWRWNWFSSVTLRLSFRTALVNTGGVPLLHWQWPCIQAPF